MQWISTYILETQSLLLLSLSSTRWKRPSFFFRIFFAVEKFFNEKKSFQRNEKLATGSQLHLLVE